MIRMRGRFKVIARNALAYGIAAAIIWYETRDLNLHYFLKVMAKADLLWFVPITLVSFGIWYFGENLLYSRMFSYFHRKTSYVELLTPTASAYLLQLINILAAGGAFVLFLHRRKGATWLGGSFTMLFLGFIDGFVLSFLTIISGACFRHSPLSEFLPYACALLGALVLIAAWWMWREPTYRLERWLHQRPALVSFRKANLSIYLTLILIRLGIFIPQGFVYYLSMRAFHIHIPLRIVLATAPAIIAAGGVPITPVGLGPLQAVAVQIFRHYASTARVMAAYLSLSAALLVYRLPLGLGAAGTYAKMVTNEDGLSDADVPMSSAEV
jgi:uncharacterized membrane protein YbhN (UPF0104 family)